METLVAVAQADWGVGLQQMAPEWGHCWRVDREGAAVMAPTSRESKLGARER